MKAEVRHRPMTRAEFVAHCEFMNAQANKQPAIESCGAQQSEIHQQLNNLNKATSEMQARLDALEQRIGPVLTESSDIARLSAPQADAASELGRTIQAATHEVMMVAEKINALTERVAL